MGAVHRALGRRFYTRPRYAHGAYGACRASQWLRQPLRLQAGNVSGGARHPFDTPVIHCAIKIIAVCAITTGADGQFVLLALF